MKHFRHLAYLLIVRLSPHNRDQHRDLIEGRVTSKPIPMLIHMSTILTIWHFKMTTALNSIESLYVSFPDRYYSAWFLTLASVRIGLSIPSSNFNASKLTVTYRKGADSTSTMTPPHYVTGINYCIHIYDWVWYFLQHNSKRSPDYHLQLFDNRKVHRVVDQLTLLFLRLQRFQQ